ncbi:ATPase, AAA-type, core [Dillenia turbinata]|uniref:ATPase, AAA-type, core n=1 Tax=Dillenia turbinata TaxID=194707 RepID=A0AAN8UJN7_9MAGN
MHQLLSMGFPDELAAEALAATGGKSTLKATDWILNHKTNNANNSSSSSSSNPPPPPPFQPKLDRFFQFHSKPEALDTLTARPEPQKFEFQPPPKKPKLTNSLPNEPLAERMRPQKIDEIVGQDHLIGENNNTSLLRSAINSNRLPSILLWGPPGTGKTSIAKAIVNSGDLPRFYRFVSLSAVTSGVKDVRDVVDEARKAKSRNGKRTVLFVDEVHRFNKSQQDSFLPVIEDGSVVFIGATTENPSFHLITPLLSRCRVLTLNPLQPEKIAKILRRAVAHSDRGLVKSVGVRVEVMDEAMEFISTNCDGDARVALNVLEISGITAAARLPIKQKDDEEGADENGVEVEPMVAIVTLDDVKEAFQCKHLAYDKAGDEHYNLISALHKSMRGSDADASIYWLARMLEGGEEPLYIARRLIRFASEDVGLADPNALSQAVACYQACHFIGMPECNVVLAQCVAYLALAPKSVAVYRAIGAAQKVVRESVGQNEGVPLHLRNAPTKLMKDLGYAKGYIYPPDNPSASSQTYLPPSLQGYKFLRWPDSNVDE